MIRFSSTATSYVTDFLTFCIYCLFFFSSVFTLIQPLAAI